ncbi:hypothetical protein BDA99DRAFT_538669 [Phascolomyces articulosus]|uniref:Xylanolytic transcriptional activator regulatory domain-containing protein n=1 Tax=Phascolomyces articulosus TaxID=60185 RepID=A0AAD5JWZ1_9FUNG|nr:hypothetical protein BDA99DRAFT_538669 [Phascolomyces articulosus]
MVIWNDKEIVNIFVKFVPVLSGEDVFMCKLFGFYATLRLHLVYQEYLSLCFFRSIQYYVACVRNVCICIVWVMKTSTKHNDAPSLRSSNKRSKHNKNASSSTATTTTTTAAEARSAAKEKKSQQDDLESLQITFYEIESWIEKTTPVLARMTKELDKASQQFDKRRKEMALEKKKTEEQQQQQQQLQQQKQQQKQQQQLFAPQPQHIVTTTTSASQIAPQLFQSLPWTTEKGGVGTATTTTTGTTSSAINDPSSAGTQTVEDQSMQWSLSFQPGNSLRLETNITSIEQLVEAVRKIKVLAEEPRSSSSASSSNSENEIDIENDDHHHNNNNNNDSDEIASASSSSSSVSVWVDPLETDPATEYWHIAIGRRPQTCLENYKHCEMNLSRLTEDVSPSVLNYIGQVFWDCLHPKFTCDWYSFWDRSGDPKRNQVCIDSGLAIVFLHVIRHDNNACNNALDIAYYYYDRARESLMEFFDSPDCATLETLMNLTLFCMVCKRHSQARIYISLAFRMMLEMGMHQRSKLPHDRILRKQYLKLYMVLYYNDVTTSIYSGCPDLIMDSDCDIDFYEIVELNKVLHRNGEAGCNENMVVKETYFVHVLELARIGKRTRLILRDYEQYLQQHQRKQHMGELPLRWAKRVQGIEIALAQWFDRLPEYYRVDPQPKPPSSSSPSSPAMAAGGSVGTAQTPNSFSPSREQRHPMPPEMLQTQSALLLMLQYQTQWILLHKTFLSNTRAFSPSTPPLDSPMSPQSPSSSSQSSLPQQRTDRSRAICTDAANRVVVLAELISERYGWCVCQQFINCIYQASTIYCRNALTKDEECRHHAKSMIHRIIRVLGSNSHNYQGLPNDLTACLHEFLAEHDMQSHEQQQPQQPQQYQPMEEGEEDDGGIRLLNQFFSCVPTTSTSPCILTGFNDTLPNSPHMYLHSLQQQQQQQQKHTDSSSPVKMQDIVPSDCAMIVDPPSLQDMKNWRYKFSSSNVAQANHRVM